MRRRLLAFTALVATVALAGCYGSTEPATNVDIGSATLNARGTTNSGSARAWFEFEVNGRVGDPQQTSTTVLPDGVSGPFRANVSGLAASTEYGFQLCGHDDDGDLPVCANTRTFTTKPAVNDAAFGSYWSGCCSGWSVDATSGPSGENPRGTLAWHSGGGFDPRSYRFSGSVSCLKVDGPRAAVVAVGKRTIIGPTGQPESEAPYVSTAVVVDGRTQADATLEADIAGTTPPSCASLTSTPSLTLDTIHELIVNDAQPQPTAR